MECLVDGCARKRVAKGLCGLHYMRQKRTGDVGTVKRRVDLTDSERFWQYVVKTATCWLWTGGQSHGYGNFHLDGRQVGAHRFAYAEVHGPIGAALVLDHVCRNKLCVRPSHLQAVSQRINVLRGDVARALRENRCVNDHEFTPDNTYVNPKGARVCLICRRASEARYRERRRAARQD